MTITWGREDPELADRAAPPPRRASSLAVVVLALCLVTTSCASDDPVGDDPSRPSPSSAGTNAAIEEMCARQESNFSWVFPIRPDYGDAGAEIEDAREGVEAERERVASDGGAEGEVSKYLDGLEHLAAVFGDPPEGDGLASVQRQFSRMMNAVVRVYKRAEAADLPSACSFGLATAEAREYRFEADAAAACRAAREDIAAAPTRALAGEGSRLERFIRLQGDFGRIYVRLADELSKAAPSRISFKVDRLIDALRRAGKARIAGEEALLARDDAGATAATREFARSDRRANRLARSLHLYFCQDLLPD